MKVTMKRKTNPYLLTLILALGLFLTGQTSFAQCDLKFDYTVENCSKGQKDCKIYITLLSGQAPMTFRLYDLINDREVDTKVLNRLGNNQKMLLFDKVSSSSYIIEVVKTGCQHKKQIGGTGIIIGTRQE
jgi:hypothetical protein